MMINNVTENLLREVFDDIILGRTKQHAQYTLIYEGVNYKKLFMEQLQVNRYRPLPLKQVKLDPNKRLPSFYLTENTAYFGYACWAKLVPGKLYKIWRSQSYKQEGTALLQFTSSHALPVWVNYNIKESVQSPWKTNTSGGVSD
jgi:hypothetical protein